MPGFNFNKQKAYIMGNFSTANYFAEESRLIPREYLIKEVDFEFLSLTDELIQAVQMKPTYNEMVLFAADSGLSYNGKRIVDDEKLAKRIPALWKKEEMTIDCDPSIKFLAGEVVCELSGLTDFIEDRRAFEEDEARELAELEAEELKAKGHLDGDIEIPDVLIDNLNDEALASAALNNANV